MTYKLLNQPQTEKVKRSRLDPDQRRAQLLEHAISAFADAGIERAVHADVACRANVSTPTVFKYFPTRDALVDAVLSEVEKTSILLQNFTPQGQNFKPSELMKIIAFAISKTCFHKPDLMRVALIWSTTFSPVRERYLILEARLQNIFLSTLNPNSMDKSDLLILSSCAREFISMQFDGTCEKTRRDYVNRICVIMDAAPLPKRQSLSKQTKPLKISAI